MGFAKSKWYTCPLSFALEIANEDTSQLIKAPSQAQDASDAGQS